MTHARLTQERLLITIDGPAGSGKSTVSRLLAERLGYTYVDTGALYRAVALEAKKKGIAPGDEAAMARFLGGMRLEFVQSPSGVRLLADGQDVTDAIREPEISLLASAVSALPVVRSYLLETQRSLGRQKGVVFEGRDMGTVVFPHADIKFFLVADPEVRARRRFLEQKGRDGQSLEAVAADMQRRDAQDTARKIAPLQQAADAVRVDTTHLTLEQVVARLFDAVENRLKNLPSC